MKRPLPPAASSAVRFVYLHGNSFLITEHTTTHVNTWPSILEFAHSLPFPLRLSLSLSSSLLVAKGSKGALNAVRQERGDFTLSVSEL